MLDSIKSTAIRQIDAGLQQKEINRSMENSSDSQSKSAQHQEAVKNAGKKDVEKAVEELNNAVKSLNISRKFEVEDELDEVVVKIMDKKEGDVIRQIPSEEAIKLEKNIKQMLGMFFDSTT